MNTSLHSSPTRQKRNLLIEGRDCKIEMSRLVVGDAGDMAYLVLKTRPAAGKAERYHTVIFAKSADGKWTISAWHAGCVAGRVTPPVIASTFLSAKPEGA